LARFYAEAKWVMVRGASNLDQELPYGNAAYSYNFKHGESGNLILEFWLTPFDYANCDGGPAASVESVLRDKLIGMAWAILDYDSNSGLQGVLEPLSKDHDVWERERPGRFPADAARSAVPETN
jgi:hypothetical protein